MSFCQNCGANLTEDPKFCQNCGALVEDTRQEGSHNERNRTEERSLTSAKKGAAKKRKRIAAICAIALVLCVGIVAVTAGWRHPVGGGSSVSSGKQTAVPAAAKSFVKEYGDRYTDPVSTYYAKQDYEANNNCPPALMSTDFINSYEISNTVDGDMSSLDFTTLELLVNSAINQQSSIDLFNNYTSVNLDCYMNVLSKNPGAKATEIINSQFLDYCSGGSWANVNNVTLNNKDPEEGQKLIDNFEAVVDKYGSNACYTIEKASNDDNLNGTLFDKAVPTASKFDSNGRVIGFVDNGVNIVI